MTVIMETMTESFERLDSEQLERLLAEEAEQSERLASELGRLSAELQIRQSRMRLLQSALERRRAQRDSARFMTEAPAMYALSSAVPARSEVKLAEAALFVLRKLGRPAHYKELLAEIHASGLTGDASASGLLNAMRRSERFERVDEAPGYWVLAEWNEEQRSRVDQRPMEALRRRQELATAEAELAAAESRLRELESRARAGGGPTLKKARGPARRERPDESYIEQLLEKERSRLAFLEQRVAELKEAESMR